MSWGESVALRTRAHVKGGLPGVGIAVLAIAFDDQNASDGILSHQTRFATVEVFVQHHGDGLGFHGLGQRRLLGVAKSDQLGLHLSGPGLQSAA